MSDLRGYHEHSDHRVILEKMAAQDAKQAEMLSVLTAIRQDMKESVVQSREDARKDRERYHNEIGDLHERINETDRIARETATKMGAIIWGIRGLWGAVAAAVVAFLVNTGG